MIFGYKIGDVHIIGGGSGGIQQILMGMAD